MKAMKFLSVGVLWVLTPNYGEAGSCLQIRLVDRDYRPIGEQLTEIMRNHVDTQFSLPADPDDYSKPLSWVKYVDGASTNTACHLYTSSGYWRIGSSSEKEALGFFDHLKAMLLTRGLEVFPRFCN